MATEQQKREEKARAAAEAEASPVAGPSTATPGPPGTTAAAKRPAARKPAAKKPAAKKPAAKGKKAADDAQEPSAKKARQSNKVNASEAGPVASQATVPPQQPVASGSGSNTLPAFELPIVREFELRL